MESAPAFKICSLCGTVWKSRHDFISDPLIELNGYQVCLLELKYGMFLFSHNRENCHTTMALPVFAFLDLYTGPRYPENKALSPECPRYCINENNLERCRVFCECAYIREVIQLIREARKGTP
jgi:hypothetical protein